MRRIEGHNGDYLLLAESLEELPWFQEVLAEAREHIKNTPSEYLPAWGRQWKEDNQ